MVARVLLLEKVIIICMARNHEGTTSGKRNIIEKGVGLLRDVHIAIGGVALAGAVLFPSIAILPVIASYEGLNALTHEGIRRTVRNRPNQKIQTQ